MSDLYGPAEPTDRVHETLTALRSDLDRAPLSDVHDVRRRGQQRARHQTVGVVAAAAAVVAVVVGGSLGLTGNDKADSRLPASPSPSASIHRPDVISFLRPADVGKVGAYDGFRRVPDAASDQKPLLCLPTARELPGSHVTYDTRTMSSLDAQYIQGVLVYDTVAGARRAERELTTAFRTCDQGDPNEVTVEDTGPTTTSGTGDVDEVVHASRLSTPLAAGEQGYYELGVARAANVLVMLQWTSQGNPYGDPGRAVWTDDHLVTAVQRAIG